MTADKSLEQFKEDLKEAIDFVEKYCADKNNCIGCPFADENNKCTIPREDEE